MENKLTQQIRNKPYLVKQREQEVLMLSERYLQHDTEFDTKSLTINPVKNTLPPLSSLLRNGIRMNDDYVDLIPKNVKKAQEEDIPLAKIKSIVPLPSENWCPTEKQKNTTDESPVQTSISDSAQKELSLKPVETPFTPMSKKNTDRKPKHTFEILDTNNLWGNSSLEKDTVNQDTIQINRGEGKDKNKASRSGNSLEDTTSPKHPLSAWPRKI